MTSQDASEKLSKIISFLPGGQKVWRVGEDWKASKVCVRDSAVQEVWSAPGK